VCLVGGRARVREMGKALRNGRSGLSTLAGWRETEGGRKRNNEAPDRARLCDIK
jgi:hypothetical protein